MQLMKTYRRLCLGVAAVILLTSAFSAPARGELLNFTFSFTGGNTSSVQGTVTGLIEGLTDNSTGGAADVIIESAPSMTSFGPSVGPLPIDTASWVKQANSFTVSNGQITAADFRAVTNGEDFLDLDYTGRINLFTLSGNSYNVANNDGLAGISFSPSVPEPGTFAIGGFAIAVLGLWISKQRGNSKGSEICSFRLLNGSDMA